MQETTPGFSFTCEMVLIFSWLNYNEELQVAKCETRQVLVTLKAPFMQQHSGLFKCFTQVDKSKSDHLRNYVTFASNIQIIHAIVRF